MTRRLSLTISILIGLFCVSTAWAQGDFEKGVSYYKQGDYRKAAVEFEQILEENPDYEAGYRVLGDSYLKLRRFAEASEAFHKAIELEDSHFASFLGAATADFNLGRYEDVVAGLLKAEPLARAPRESYQLHQLRGSAYYNLGRFERAVADLEKALSIQRGVYRDLLQLGVAHFQLGNLDEAERYLQQAQGLQPESAEARRFLSRIRYQRAVVLIEEKQYTAAAARLQSYLEENPQDDAAWYNLGLAHLFAEETDEAKAAFQKAVERDPENWDAYNRLGYLHEIDQEYARSLEAYRKALELHGSSSLQESVDRIRERLRRQENL